MGTNRQQDSRWVDFARSQLKRMDDNGVFLETNNRHNWRFFKKLELCSELAHYENGGEIVLPLRWNAKSAQDLIREANKGDFDADMVLREIAAELIERSTQLPEQLQIYTAAALRARYRKQKNKRGRKSQARVLFNQAVPHLVYTIARGAKIYPTRSSYSRKEPQKPSACSIVAEAMGKEESDVAKTWQLHGSHWKKLLKSTKIKRR